MNANELADELEIAQGNNNVDELIPEAIAMLRQQHAEIAELKAINQYQNTCMAEYLNQIVALKKTQEK